MRTYIGLTIGPIITTLQGARKTGELWGSSYIFSYMIKKLIEPFVEEGREFIIPYTKDRTRFARGKEIGLFHDRFIFKAQDQDFEKLRNIINELLENMGKEIAQYIGENRDKVQRVQRYIEKHFRIYFVEMDLEEGDNPILKINAQLDVLEMRQQYGEKEDKNYLQLFLENQNKRDRYQNSFLIRDAFSDEKVKDMEFHPFDSLLEIGVWELGVKPSTYEEISNENKYIEKIKETLKKRGDKKKFRKIHKYVAIVQADGDNIGEVIKALNEESVQNVNSFQDFSKKLFDFAEKAHQLIQCHGGMTIYAGGDDLLFIAPVLYGEGTIFDLLGELSSKFRELANMPTSDGKKASLSFGVSISYYRYPLYEALEQARNLLFNQAKEYEFKTEGKKNAIAFKVLKHSGQAFGGIIPKESKSYRDFKNILNKTFDNDFLRSIHFTLYQEQKLIEQIIYDEKRIKDYLENRFNESIHDEHKKYLEDIGKLIVHLGQEYNVKSKKEEKNEESNSEAMDHLFSYLRFIMFVHEKGEEDE